MVSDVYFLVSLHCYYMLCMIRQLALVHRYPFQYSKVCSSMMSIHPKGGGSALNTRVSLINVDMVSGLIKCCWLSPFSTVCRGSLQVVIALFSAIRILHIRLGGRRSIMYRTWWLGQIYLPVVSGLPVVLGWCFGEKNTQGVFSTHGGK